jgi:alpha-beta hydrolase superfamily lysophospholipase
MKRVGELKTPALVIQGGEDHVADPAGSEKWVKMAPQGLAELRLYPGLYHEVLAERGRTEIIASLIDWLEKPMASRGATPRGLEGASTPPRASRS